MGVEGAVGQGETEVSTETILVTGASGFVGSMLCPILEAKGLEVRRASRTPRPGYIAVDPLAEGGWPEALAGCRAVVHLAGRAHDRDATAAEFEAANHRATLRIAEAAASAGVRRFVFLSSVKVMGEASPAGRGFTEADPPGPVGPYARSKVAAERGLKDIAARTGVEVVVIRPPLVHGPGVRGNLLALMRALERGWPLPFGAVGNRRSLVGVRNLSALIALAVDHPAAAGEIFLVSDGEDISTADLVRRLAQLLDRPARLLSLPPPLVAASLWAVGRGGASGSLLGDLAVDAGKARRLLDWSPSTTLDAGLAEMVAAYRGAGR